MLVQNTEYLSWGRAQRPVQDVEILVSRISAEVPKSDFSVLPYGQGRSYGDSCLNDGGILLSTSRLQHLIDFNPVTGTLRCEAGTTLGQILDFAVPRGWFIPVVPGTKFVSVGGAIANDIHGKNHHRAGTFGCHVPAFELLRSDGTRLLCSAAQNAEYYTATIGGLGLTGLILWADIQLVKISNPLIDSETIKFANLDEFFDLTESSDQSHEYTVAWIDCLSTGKFLGRGLFIRGNANTDPANHSAHRRLLPTLSVPFDFPESALNQFTIRAFNTLYYNKQLRKHRSTTEHYEGFFFPLDSILHWNRIYGRRGLYQLQLVLPAEKSASSLRTILQLVADSKCSSFLTTAKKFGSVASPGMLSFPRAGATICLDFANNGAPTAALMHRVRELVTAADGAIYAAKDACMDQDSFRQYYPRWKEFSDYIDPRFSSGFWRRINGTSVL